MSDETTRPERTSDLLVHLATQSDSETLTLGELLDGLSDRTFGIVMLVLALPCCVPFIYILPQIVSVPMVLVALQIVYGRHTLMMPARLRAREFPRESFEKVARRARPYLRFFENFARPRAAFLTRGLFERLFGLFMIIFAISVAVPLPLTNTVPGIAIAIMSVGFLERDGLLVFLGTVLGTIWVSLLVVLGASLAIWLSAAKDWVLALF